MSTTIITKPKVTIDPSLLAQLKEQVHEQGQVVLHFLLNNTSSSEVGIRIWPTSYLFDLHGDHRSELVHVENITMYPTWQLVAPNTSNYFTLIFSGLPKSCAQFQFKEICSNQAGAWCVDSIMRNNSDVYYLRID